MIIKIRERKRTRISRTSVEFIKCADRTCYPSRLVNESVACASLCLCFRLIFFFSPFSTHNDILFMQACVLKIFSGWNSSEKFNFFCLLETCFGKLLKFSTFIRLFFAKKSADKECFLLPFIFRPNGVYVYISNRCKNDGRAKWC